MTTGGLRLVADGWRVTLVAPDQPGLLAVVTGVLAVNRLSVRAATGTTEGDMAVEVFDLDPGRSVPDWAAIEADIARTLEHPETLETRVRQRSENERQPRRPEAARLAAPRVLVDNEATPRGSILEVRAPDAVGLLYRVAQAIAACSCDISVVRAVTLGHEVVDTLYVTDSDTGEKLYDSARLRTVERAVLDALSSAP
jgi:[protein-PII] uridylyltransferase